MKRLNKTLLAIFLLISNYSLGGGVVGGASGISPSCVNESNSVKLYSEDLEAVLISNDLVAEKYQDSLLGMADGSYVIATSIEWIEEIKSSGDDIVYSLELYDVPGEWVF